MESKIDLFISTGEISGDLLAASIVEHLPKETSMGGIIGPELRKLGIKQFFPMELFEMHGLSQVIKGLPRIIRNYWKIKQTILHLNPKVVLLVDNAEFSLLMAGSLRKGGYKGKIVQLVCPTVWAWRKNRMKKMIRTLDLVLSLFPNETELFAKTTLAVEFIGHPLVEKLSHIQTDSQSTIHPAPMSPVQTEPKSLSQLESQSTIHPEPKTTIQTEPKLGEKKLFALFPGSRKHELILNFPLQLRAAKLIQQEYNIVVSATKASYIPLLKKMALQEGVEIKLVPFNKRHELMKMSDLALAKCGTTIFELGILNTPTIVMYKMSLLDLLGAISFRIFLAHYALPNILLGKRVFPEYIGYHARQDLISNEVVRCARKASLRLDMKTSSKELSTLYHNKEASKEGATKIHDLLLLPF